MLLLLALIAAPIAFELELAGGGGHTLETPGYPVVVPALQARAAIDLFARVASARSALLVMLTAGYSFAP